MRETLISEVDNLRASKHSVILELLVARNKLIRGEEFEDEEKFKRFISTCSLQITKINLERKRNTTKKQVSRQSRKPDERDLQEESLSV